MTTTIDPIRFEVLRSGMTQVAEEMAAPHIFSYRTSGGGGYGAPAERDAEKVAEDVRDGKISLERARDVYEVAIDIETLIVDQAETARLRSERD